jgi:predicted ATPase/DNA-binding SARP family transcriptional activator
MARTSSICLLGSLDVRLDGSPEPVAISAPRQRALLALLALNAPAIVPLQAIIDGLWESAPPTSRNTVQQLVSALRRLLGSDAVVAAQGGYRLAVVPGQVDARRFEAAVSNALDHPPPTPRRDTADALAEALDMWSGEPLADLPDVPFVEPARRALQAGRERAERAWASILVEIGEAEKALPRLRTLQAANPLDESVAATLMLALASNGQVDEALQAFAETRNRLSDDLGLDPGPQLRTAHEQVLRHEAPARRAVVTVLSPLPRLPDDLLGREGVFSDIVHRMSGSECPVVTLVGPGGVGKTHLALSIAHRLSVRRPVMWIDLSPLRSTAQVASEIAAQLGIRDDGSRSPLEAVSRAAYRSRLCVVLDNCEHIPGVADLVAEFLVRSDASLQVLATSRSRLHLHGEHVIELEGLLCEPTEEGEAAAVQLFLRRADLRTTKPEILEDVRTITSAVDGLPLAVELAAARARLTGTAGVRAELSAPDALTWRPQHHASERHLTLRGCIEWSLDLLPMQERTLLPMLTIFPATFDLAAVRGVCQGLIDSDVADLLQSLVDAHLVRTTDRGRTTRFGLLATVRSMAAGELEDSALKKQLAHHHAHHYADRFVAERTGGLWPPRTVVEWEALDQDVANLDAAQITLVEAGEWSAACDLTLSLCNGLLMRGRQAELQRRLDLLQASGALTPVQQTRVLGWQSILAATRGDWTRRGELLEDACALARDEGLFTDLAEALGGKAQDARDRGDPEEACDLAKEAISYARRGGDREIEALLHIHMADPEDIFAFRRAIQLALDIAQEHGNQTLEWFIKSSVSHLGLRSHSPEIWRLCRDWGYAAHDLSMAFRTPDVAVFVRSNTATCSLLLGEYEGTIEVFLDTLEWATRMGQQPLAVESLFRLAAAHTLSGVPADEGLAAAAIRLAGPDNDLAWQHQPLLEVCFPEGLTDEGAWSSLDLDECIAGARTMRRDARQLPLFNAVANA